MLKLVEKPDVIVVTDPDIVPCPCCHGEKFLFEHDEEFPDEPPKRVRCCHCQQQGVKAMDNRSMNSYE